MCGIRKAHNILRFLCCVTWSINCVLSPLSDVSSHVNFDLSVRSLDREWQHCHNLTTQLVIWLELIWTLAKINLYLDKINITIQIFRIIHSTSGSKTSRLWKCLWNCAPEKTDFSFCNVNTDRLVWCSDEWSHIITIIHWIKNQLKVYPFVFLMSCWKSLQWCIKSNKMIKISFIIKCFLAAAVLLQNLMNSYLTWLISCWLIN